jgi:FixJ family two-component response regulator
MACWRSPAPRNPPTARGSHLKLTTFSTVFVVDDDRSVLSAVARLLRSAGHKAETFASPREFLERLHSAEPGCLVVDLHTPELSGLELQEAMVRAGYRMPVIFMSGQADVRSIVKAMQGGAIDFLIKPFDQRQLLEAIDRAIARDLEVRAERDTFRLNLLTPREREVCALVAAGRLNKQIAGKLGVTEKTIKAHLRRVMQKLQVRSLVDLVRIVDRAR